MQAMCFYWLSAAKQVNTSRLKTHRQKTDYGVKLYSAHRHTLDTLAHTLTPDIESLDTRIHTPLAITQTHSSTLAQK